MSATSEVKERIFLEATRLFGEKGYGSTSVREVARAAGVSNPALYYHFGSKEGLYLETIRLHTEAAISGLEAMVRGPGTVVERIRSHLQANIDFIHANRSAARLIWYANHRPENGEPQVDVMSLHMRSSELLMGLFREGIATGEIRADVNAEDAMMALMGQAMLVGMAALAGYPLPEDLPDRLLGTLMNGVGA